MWKLFPNCCRPGNILVACLIALLGSAFGGATVTIPQPPLHLSPGVAVAVNVQFTKTSNEPEKLVVVRVDLHDSLTHEKVSGGIADNGGAGFPGTTGLIQCNVPVPADASGNYYFRAWVAPWSLNRAIVSRYKSYPINGIFTYEWPGGGYGVTQDIFFKGTLIAPKPTADTTYCSGLAFETCVLAFQDYNETYGHSTIGNIQTADHMKIFRRIWYGVSDADKLAARAIPEWGVGREITNFEEAQEGDFIQLWRNSGSGHNPVFVSWKRGTSNEITGVYYWGSQGSTNGIGYNDENFGTWSSRINPDRFYLGRAAKPRDQADYDWALGQADTSDTPANTDSAVADWALYKQ